MTTVRTGVVLRWGPVVAWAGLIWFLSSRSAVPALPLSIPHLDKVLHAVIFGALAWLLVRALGAGRRRAALAVLLAVVWGATDEAHQSTVPGRLPSWGDMVADGVGAFLGALVGNLRGLRLRSSGT